jgi:uncharacterized protein YerC
MGKYSNIERLNKPEQDELFISFVKLLSGLSNTITAAHVIKGLLTEQEVLTIARRLKVVELLNDGRDYKSIRKQLKISDATIAKVQLWMRSFPDGFDYIAKHTDKSKPNISIHESGWRQHKKQYPMYYWPQLVLEEIVQSSNKRERERLHKIINQLHEKTKLTKRLELLLRNKTKL